jgi:hypothetical protein
VPISLVFLVAALVTLVAPGAWHRMDRARSMERSRAYAAFGAEFLDSVQGLGTLNYATRRGLYLHPTLAVTPERLPLGDSRLLELDPPLGTRPRIDPLAGRLPAPL